MAQHFDRKNILVVGGAGFIGSHLCDRLLRDAHVICIDNFSSSSEKNIEQHLQDPNFECIHHDITQPLHLEKLIELEKFNVRFQGIQEIYFVACSSSKRQFTDFKIATMLTDSIGIKQIADIAVKYRAKIVYASSGILYGSRRSSTALFNETDECRLDHLTEHGAYDEGKRFSESILETYAKVHSLDIKIARIFHTYGPRMKPFDGACIPDMVVNALRATDIVIPGNEDSSISLVYVSDIVDGLVRMMTTPINVRVINLGSAHSLRFVHVAQTILNLTDSPSQVRFKGLEPQMTEMGLPDILRAREILEWSPLVSLEDGLTKMIRTLQADYHL